MTFKSIATAILLGFVAASIAMLAFGDSGTPDSTPEATESTRADRLIVYYLHGNIRCTTCRSIESQTVDAVKTGFADELRDGRIELKTVNVEEPANRHFVGDYKLVTRSVVLSRIADGKESAWKNLDRVWELVRDKADFRAYIQRETRAFLEPDA
jgi:hypothetical protein